MAHAPDNSTPPTEVGTMATPAGGAGGGAGGLVKRTPEQVQAQNLMILQRKDEAVSEILATATYVVIYVFEPKCKQWERKEIEGSLFIVKRSFGVRFRLVVLNRINPTDLEQDLTGSFTFEDMSPYLLYRTNAEGEGKGGKVETLAIWFHNEKDKGNIAACLRKVLRLQAGTADQQMQAERQEQTHQALLEPSSMLPAAPPEQAGAGAGAAAEGASGGDSKPVSSIEEMLLKAARVSTGSSSPAPSPSAAPQASPPTVMDMLLRPQALQQQQQQQKSPATGPAAAAKGLLNPMALAAAAAKGGGGGGVQANGASSSSSSSVVLDKAQLKAALLSLLEEDDAFVETLHRAYLKKVQQK